MAVLLVIAGVSMPLVSRSLLQLALLSALSVWLGVVLWRVTDAMKNDVDVGEKFRAESHPLEFIPPYCGKNVAPGLRPQSQAPLHRA